MVSSSVPGREDMQLFKRDISMEAWRNEEGRLVVEGTLKDLRQGETTRHIEVRLELDPEDGRIHSLEGSMPRITYDECREALASLSLLEGVHVAPGYSKLVRETVGSTKGCTHLAVLLSDLGHACTQARGAMLYVDSGGGEDALDEVRKYGVAMGVMGNCLTWREDGPRMRRIRKMLEDGG
jgi:hypothetical protein